MVGLHREDDLLGVLTLGWEGEDAQPPSDAAILLVATRSPPVSRTPAWSRRRSAARIRRAMAARLRALDELTRVGGPRHRRSRSSSSARAGSSMPRWARPGPRTACSPPTATPTRRRASSTSTRRSPTGSPVPARRAVRLPPLARRRGRVPRGVRARRRRPRLHRPGPGRRADRPTPPSRSASTTWSSAASRPTSIVRSTNSGRRSGDARPRGHDRCPSRWPTSACASGCWRRKRATGRCSRQSPDALLVERPRRDRPRRQRRRAAAVPRPTWRGCSDVRPPTSRRWTPTRRASASDGLAAGDARFRAGDRHPARRRRFPEDVDVARVELDGEPRLLVRSAT